MSGSALLGGVIAGLLATFAWYFCVRTFSFVRLRKYDGRYSITRKQETEPLKHQALVSVRWWRDGLGVRFESLPPNDWVKGRILMSGSFHGAGSYKHRKGGELLWGIWNAQVLDEKALLIDTTYSKHATRETIHNADVWARIERSD